MQVGVAVLGGEGELSDALAHLHESMLGSTYKAAFDHIVLWSDAVVLAVHGDGDGGQVFRVARHNVLA